MADDAEILVHWRAGRGIRQIARSLGYARNTVRERIATATAAGFAQEGPPLSAAEWRAALAAAGAERGDRERRFPAQQRIEQLGDKVTEALKASTAATVWQRLHDAGELDVGRRTFQRYVHERIRSVDPARLTVPMPDPVFGEAMELDYGRMGMWTDPRGAGRRAVWAFVATLRASNTHFVRPVLVMDQETWIRCHIEAADFFGGSARFWICDNLKAGVLKADLYDPRLNRGYRECAEHYGALIDPARIFAPKDKPRVERAQQFVRDSWWSGKQFQSFEAMIEDARAWSADVAMRRRHPRMALSVGEVFRLHEQPALIALPASPFMVVRWQLVTVHPDRHVAIDRALYSVPWQHVGKQLQAKIGGSLIELYDGDTLVKTHVKDGRRRQTDQGDLPPDKVAFLMRTPAWCRRQAAEVGSSAASLVDALLAQGGLTRLREVQALLRLSDKYEAKRLEAACALALTADGRMKTVRNILESGLDRRQQELLPATEAGAYLHGREAIVGEGAR
ncbi:MAG: IS21 family transposase [Chloroflexota bacterium]|nr:IS21 family transposase [Chloroflexota bacterium]